MTNQRIETTEAPGAIAPYSQAILANGILYVSGQIPLDPQTGNLIGETIQEQTEQVIKNVQAILKAAGCSLTKVVSSTVFLTHFDRDFEGMNEVYKKYFSHDAKPARAAIGVNALPKKALVEIQCIAHIG